MGLPVVTVASGGLPVVETTRGTPVTEAANLRGVAVTKVVGKPGLPVVFVTEAGVVVPAVTYVTWDAATVTAVTAVSLLSLHSVDFQILSSGNPEIAETIRRTALERRAATPKS